MINTENKKEIFQYIIDRNVPIDLALEIRDHMLSQIEAELEENEDFYVAFNKVKKTWKYDLHSIYPLLSWKAITRIHLHSVRKISYDLQKQSLYYFLPLFLLISILTYSIPQVTKNILFVIYIAILVVSASLYFKNFKLINSANTNFKTNVSIYQRGTTLFLISSMYIVIFNLFNYSERYEKYSTALINVIDKYEFTLRNLSYIVLVNIFIWAWILGSLYLKKYINAFEKVDKQIKIKL